MRLVYTESVKPGTKLAKAIYNEKGQALVKEGVELSERLIKRLYELGIFYIYIEDERAAHIQLHHDGQERVRQEATKKIEAVFRELQLNTNFSDSFVIEKASKRFVEIIRDLINQIKSDQEILSLLSDTIAYDNYIFSHSVKVTMNSLAIGLQLKLSEKELETLGLGAILHDIGKIKISPTIMKKPGKLTEEEFNEMKEHCQIGFDILRNVQTLPLLVAHCAYQHHERLNGSGYPRGLHGDQIHLFGKIIAVADVFDAVTSNRVYRKAMLPQEGLEILYAGADSLFDHTIVEAFRQTVAIYPIGMMVVLNDGRRGIVAAQNSGIGDRPFVEIIEEQGQKLENSYLVNMKEEFTLMIIHCEMD
ncbi:HD-GYP domain-containing protein [Bacillaceae bacterium Marseille-Q3522]|nr:HD-GYP domain-containing protein [Bacillaceae bacterium Marseille-Q3522]